MEEMKTKLMKEAIKEAQKALNNGEVPVGAIIELNGKIIARAYNQREIKQNATYHAEILAIQKACKKLKSFRLNDCNMYVTLEPCAMCSGAIINSRINKVFIGANDDNYGCCGSKYNLVQDKSFEHLVSVESGICERECKDLIQMFFTQIREKNKFKKYLGKEVICEKNSTNQLITKLGGKEIFIRQEQNNLEKVNKVAGIIDYVSEMRIEFFVSNQILSVDEIYDILLKEDLIKKNKQIKIITIGGEKKNFIA